MGFLLDASSSVGIDQFTTEKNFVKLLSEEILTASPNSRAGVIVFSDYPILSLTFSDFAELTPSRFEALIGDLPYQTGRTRIDLALGMASRKLFVDKRDSVDQVSLVMMVVMRMVIVIVKLILIVMVMIMMVVGWCWWW